MKRKLLLIVALGALLSANAQVITVKSKTGDVVNDTVYVHTDENGVGLPDTIKFHTILNDTFAVNQEVTVTRRNINRCTNSQNYFCWAQCYTTAISDINYFTAPDKLFLVPGEDTLKFSAYHIANGETGNATYRFGFSVKGNVDTVFVDVRFEVAGSCEDAIDEEIGSKFSITPNPATDFILISNSFNNESFHVEILDNKGAIIKSLKNQYGSANINTSTLQKGLYFVRIINNEGNYFSKTVIISQ